MQAHVDKEVTMMTMIDDVQPVSNESGAKPLSEEIEVVFSNTSKYYYWHFDKLGLPRIGHPIRKCSDRSFSTSKQPFNFFKSRSRYCDKKRYSAS
jgi:hypothetical protein